MKKMMVVFVSLKKSQCMCSITTGHVHIEMGTGVPKESNTCISFLEYSEYLSKINATTVRHSVASPN